MRLPKVYKRTRNDYYENTKKKIQKEQEIAKAVKNHSSLAGQKPLPQLNHNV